MSHSDKKRKQEETDSNPNKRGKYSTRAPVIHLVNIPKSLQQSCCNSDNDDDDDDYTDEEEYIEENEEILEREEIMIPDHLKKIETIDQLIELGSLYNKNKYWKGSIDLRRLHKLIEPLTKLKKMIGMESIKKAIIDFILFYLQDLDGGKNKDYMHTVLEGPPGCGKTEIGRILAELYFGMEITKRNYFRVVKRHDLIGQYLGQTAPRTQKVVDDCMGGVMFIDEAYSLGNPEGRDIFSKECLDTLNQNLSEHKNKFICIIAGYKDALKHSFFSMNEGLLSRFPIRFEVDPYKGNELFHIFKKIVREQNWDFDQEDTLSDEFFVKHEKDFPYFGRDMEVLFQKTKISHAKRIYSLPIEFRRKIQYGDIIEGFSLYEKMHKDRSKSGETKPPDGLYL